MLVIIVHTSLTVLTADMKFYSSTKYEFTQYFFVSNPGVYQPLDLDSEDY